MLTANINSFFHFFGIQLWALTFRTNYRFFIFYIDICVESRYSHNSHICSLQGFSSPPKDDKKTENSTINLWKYFYTIDAPAL